MSMNVVAGVVQQQQVGQEATLGAGGTANRLLGSMMLEFGDELSVQKYRGQGRRHTNRVEPEMQWTTLGLTGHADYIEILYAIEAAFGTVAPTTTGIAAFKRVYDVPLTGKITPKSLTAQWGDTTNVNQVGYGIFHDIGLKLARKSAPAVSGSGIAQLKTTGGSFTASPTAEPIEPILASHINYWLDTTGAGIGTTQVPQEILTADWDYKGLFVPFWASNRSDTSYAGHLDSELSTEVKVDFAESTLSRTVDAAMSTGTTYFLRLDMTGPLIPGETSTNWTLWIDCAVKLTKKDKWSVADQVYKRGWTFEIVEDATWGHACEITSITSLATL